MGKISIHFFQPVASYLGYRKPGGFRLDVNIDGPCPLRYVLTGLSFRSSGLNILEQLENRQNAAMVAINGRVDHSSLDAEVLDGDKVSFLTLHGGG